MERFTSSVLSFAPMTHKRRRFILVNQLLHVSQDHLHHSELKKLR
jgi:hypothetical protein